MSGTVREITDASGMLGAMSGEHVACVHVWGSWAAQCAQIDAVLGVASQQNPNVAFYKMDAEAVPDLTESLKVTAVPTVVFVHHGAEVDRVVGADVAGIVARIEKANAGKLISSSSSTSAAADKKIVLPRAEGSDKPLPPKGGGPGSPLWAQLEQLVNSKPVMLFMKGTPDEPKCGFSRTAVGLLRDNGGCSDFGHFDILSDDTVRQGLKEYSNWPTYPQLYVCGKLVGGLDILKELAESGELASTLATANEAKAAALRQRLVQLTQMGKVVLFMKGTPETPRCGFSRTMVGLLQTHKTEFSHFDILSDEEVRQGLKEYANWPTYPQLWVNGKLLGGLDVIKEMAEEGELEEALK